VLEAERTDGANLTIELRNARSTLDQIQREQKAQQAANPSPQPQPQPQPQQPQQQSAHQPYPYGAYAYRYGNPPSSSDGASGATSTPYAYSYTPTPVATSAPSAALAYTVASNIWPRPVAPTSAPSSASSTPAPSTAAPVPVQIPVSALGSLTQLGIVPVAEASIPAGQPRPQCVMTGIQQNGSILSLEINVGSLQSAQVNGLAVLLGSLMTGRDVNQDAGGSLSADGSTTNTSTASNPVSAIGGSTTSSAGASPGSS
jgi:hypothetical protein